MGEFLLFSKSGELLRKRGQSFKEEDREVFIGILSYQYIRVWS